MTHREIRSHKRDPAAVERILEELPDWFGIDEANAAYVKSASVLDSYLALDNGQVVGVLLIKEHFATAAEIHLLAVSPDHHRQGIGTALLETAEHDLSAAGRTLMQVKTLGPSDPSPAYQQTRLFYERRGFVPIDELHGLWPDNPCLIMVKSLPIQGDGA